MEFILIMGIGTVVAIVVVACQPRSGYIPYDRGKDPFAYKARPKTLASQKDLSEVVAVDEIDYMRKLGRHMDDPRHWPAPLPPPPPPKAKHEEFY